MMIIIFTNFENYSFYIHLVIVAQFGSCEKLGG